MTRVAAIDCGTNSIRLLIAESRPGGGLVDLDRRLEMVRLGQGVDATGEFHPDALERTFAATASYADVIAERGVDPTRIRFVATSASRDAGNREQFFSGVRDRLGVAPEVISGDEEARLSFAGALSRVHPPSDPVLVMDIGGGSTELIIGTRDGEIIAGQSLDIGSVRLTERMLPSDPATDTELQRAREFVDAQLLESGIDLPSVRSWVGVAGTATTLAAMHLRLLTYDRERVHGAAIASSEIAGLVERLHGRTADDIRTIPSMHPRRADVITAGALIAERVAARVAAENLIVSESDILDGIALRLLAT